MPRYIVEVPEVWYRKIVVEADSAYDAVDKVENGQGEKLDAPRYSHALHPFDSNKPQWKVTNE